MDAECFRSPLSSESQDEWGSGLWMAGDLTPQALDEDMHCAFPEQQQATTENPSRKRSDDFPSPPPSSPPEDAVIKSNLGLTNMYNTAKDHEWPPVATQPVQAGMDQHSNSPEGSDSIVFLSEDSEEQGIDCKPLDFTSAREQWVRRDSSSTKPPTPAFSRSSSRDLITEEYSPHIDPSILHQQEEPDAQILSPDNEDQEVQQVCTPAPPLETVAGEQAANPDLVSPTCGTIVVKEPLIETAEGRRKGDRESEQTDRERKQTVSGSGVVETRRERGTEHLGKGTSTDAVQRARKMDRDQFEDSQSDSGVSADFSPSSTTEISSTSMTSSFPDPSETPIEREIRLAIRREQSLRRARGMEPEEDKAKAFVEIPMRKSILSHDLPLKSMQSEGKDRQFAGKKMQQEIQAEVEREKALVQLGRLPGFYDKGTVRQLREKKRLFEAFQEPKECLAMLNNRPSSSCEISNGGAQIPVAVRLSKERTRSLEFLDAESDGGFIMTSTGHHGPGLTEGTKGQVIILESTPLSVAQTPGQIDRLADRSTTVVDGSGSGRSFSVKPYSVGRVRIINCEDRDDIDGDNAEESATVKDNPFFKLRSSLSLRPDVQQDIQEAREREKELRMQRTSLYGWGSEVDGAISSTVPPTSNRIPTTPEQPGKSSITITTSPVRQSLGKLDLTWPPPQEENKTQTEVQKSPKRHKSVLLQRWENGLVNGHGEQQE